MAGSWRWTWTPAGSYLVRQSILTSKSCKATYSPLRLGTAPTTSCTLDWFSGILQEEAGARAINPRDRPGGWLLLEEVDFVWTDVGMQPICPERYCEPYIRVWKAAVAYMKERGFDGHWGRHLAPFLREAGLRDVAGEASMLIGDSDLTLAMRLTVGRLGPALIEGGSVSVKALADFDDLMRDPDVLFTGSPTFSVWGRRPVHGCTAER